ncbi:unnamed protein product [Candidula unifasciata]|uniref:J domain-containing protein n=1 Tax=Candidula unifasciata TaxID=100452 RepID=A0A8S3YWK4_9EUPU|nr:unnamed protein product [Candidula unifasciata]
MNKVFDDIISHQQTKDDDYYFILGCNENSTTEQITCEYKSRVLSCHPDKHQHDESAHEKFSRLSQAKDTLLDPEKRKEYDKWRHSGIAIPFERWRSLSHVKTSMHWGFCKEQAAIDHPEAGDQQRRAVSPSRISTQQDNNFQELKEKLKFTPRETSTGTSNRSPKMGWEKDTSNPLLHKFRNYEI